MRCASTRPTCARSWRAPRPSTIPPHTASTTSTTARVSRFASARRPGGSSSSRRLVRLRPGRYMFVATHEGMFGGRDFAYLTVVGPGEPVTPISSGPQRRFRRRRSPTRCYPWRQLSSRLLFVLLLAPLVPRSGPRARRRFWAAGFACFAVATVVRGRRAAARMEPCALPHLLPRRRRPDRRVPRRGLGLAASPAPRAGRPARRPRGRQRSPRLLSIWLAPVDAHALAATASGRPPENGVARRARLPVGGRLQLRRFPRSSSAARCTRSHAAAA